MSLPIPLNEPFTLYAGQTATWKRSFSDFPASTWTLTYYLLKSGTQITITASADGDDHFVDIAPATSAAYAAGAYHWVARVTDGTDVHMVDSGELEIILDYSTQTTGADLRGHAQIMLAKIETLLEGKADEDVSSYMIAGRQLVKMSSRQLLEWRDYYRREVAKLTKLDRIRNGEPHRGRIMAKFVQ